VGDHAVVNHCSTGYYIFCPVAGKNVPNTANAEKFLLCRHCGEQVEVPEHFQSIRKQRNTLKRPKWMQGYEEFEINLTEIPA